MKAHGVVSTGFLNTARLGMLAGFPRFLSVFSVLLFLGSLLCTGQPIAEDLIEIEVSTDSSEISPNSEIWVEFQVSLAPNWHIYWKNSGESGYPTSITWIFDHPDWKVEPLQYSPPYLYAYEGMSGYALNEQVTLLAQLIAPNNLNEVIKVKGKLDTLICNESTCLPYEFSFSLNFSGAENQKFIENNVVSINDAKKKLPVPLPNHFSAKANFDGKTGSLLIKGEEIAELSSGDFNFFPESQSVLIKHHTPYNKINSNTLEIEWQFLGVGEESPITIDGLLTHPNIPKAWKVSVPINFTESKPSPPSIPLSQFSNVQNDFHLLNVLIAFVVIAMAVWGWGRSFQPQALTKSWKCFAIISLCFGLWIGFPSKPETVSSNVLNWVTWSQKLQDQLLAEGKAIYIDYTAKWCLSCQVNKRVYSVNSVVSSFLENDITLLRADWTKRSPDILRSLQSHGREGVPFNVYYPSVDKGSSATPLYLPEILSSESLIKLINSQDGYHDNSNSQSGYLTLLGFAWIGGLILNLMPCVFPVIGLKIMGFVKQAGENPSQIKRHGWVFTIGVLVSFWLLVGTLLFLRDSLEHELGWGFQLQNPEFVLVLAVLLFLFGLSLSGVYDIGMSLTGLGAGLSKKSGLWGSFFSGVLATVVATPCMAPFLGVAVGAALTMQAIPSIAIFTSIAIGLSTPYLLLSFFPSWIEKLPKPGAWMESFKQLMAFPVYATVAWLIWTLNGLL